MTQSDSLSIFRRISRKTRLCPHAWRLLVVLVSLAGLLVASSPVPSNATITYTWPMRTERKIIGKYNNPPEPWLPGHRGVDIYAVLGRSVYASGDGIVIYASDLAGRGVVSISHGWFRTTYEPVAPSVVIGQSVKKDQQIGRITNGAAHCGNASTGYCLHWGMRTDTKYFNPLLLIRPKGKLVPIGAPS